MVNRLYRAVTVIFIVSCVASFVLDAAHPAGPARNADVLSYIAISARWHEILLVVCIAQLVSAAMLCALMAASGNALAGTAVLLAVVGINTQLVHAIAEAFVFPSLAGAVDAARLRQIVGDVLTSQAMDAASVAGMILVFSGMLFTAFNAKDTRFARILAAVAAVLLPVSLVTPQAFDGFEIAMYGALCFSAIGLTNKSLMEFSFDGS